MALLRRPTLRRVAEIVDSLGDTRDRLITALDFSEMERPGDMELLAMRETGDFARARNFRPLLPIRPPEELRWLVVPLAALAILWWDGLRAAAERDARIASATAEVAGTVAQLVVRPGQAVTKGQVLARLDGYPFDLSVRDAQASTDEAEQRFLESFVPESVVTGRGPTPEQRKALMNKAGLIGARLRLERAKYEQDRATIRSPVNGTVDAIEISAGEKVSAGQALLTVVDTRNLRIEAQVLEHDLPLVRVGGEASISSAGAPGRLLRGRVDALLPLVDSVTRAGRAIVRVQGDGTLRPGMYADVQLEATRLPGRRMVPSRAVIERDGRPLVFVVKDGRAQWTYIVPGRTNGVDTEVLPDSTTGQIPVNPGDQIITEGHLTLTHDAPVRVTAPREGAPRESGDTARLDRAPKLKR